MHRLLIALCLGSFCVWSSSCGERSVTPASPQASGPGQPAPAPVIPSGGQSTGWVAESARVETATARFEAVLKEAFCGRLLHNHPPRWQGETMVWATVAGTLAPLPSGHRGGGVDVQVFVPSTPAEISLDALQQAMDETFAAYSDVDHCEVHTHGLSFGEGGDLTRVSLKTSVTVSGRNGAGQRLQDDHEVEATFNTTTGVLTSLHSLWAQRGQAHRPVFVDSSARLQVNQPFVEVGFSEPGGADADFLDIQNDLGGIAVVDVDGDGLRDM